MSKPGYLIASTIRSGSYFTSRSAYDKPEWVKLKEATTYMTADIAETAMKKLIKNGAYAVRLVSLDEAMSFEFPDETKEVAPRDDVIDAPIDGQDDEMVAQDQRDVCQQCDHEPCTCEQPSDEVDPLDDNPVDDNPMDDITPVGSKDPQSDLPQDDETGDFSELGVTRESVEIPVEKITFKDPAVVGNPAEVMGNDDDKISVPSNVSSDLSAAIAEFTKIANDFNGRDDARAAFAATVADAMTMLQTNLSGGTTLSMKQAQLALSTMMNPITSNIPASVLKFINMGGRKPSLKDLFNDKRISKKDNK